MIWRMYLYVIWMSLGLTWNKYHWSVYTHLVLVPLLGCVPSSQSPGGLCHEYCTCVALLWHLCSAGHRCPVLLADQMPGVDRWDYLSSQNEIQKQDVKSVSLGGQCITESSTVVSLLLSARPVPSGAMLFLVNSQREGILRKVPPWPA